MLCILFRFYEKIALYGSLKKARASVFNRDPLLWDYEKSLITNKIFVLSIIFLKKSRKKYKNSKKLTKTTFNKEISKDFMAQQ